MLFLGKSLVFCTIKMRGTATKKFDAFARIHLLYLHYKDTIRTFSALHWPLSLVFVVFIMARLSASF